MKKLANLIALFILVSVNVVTPLTYAQEVLEADTYYNCTLAYGEWGDPYYSCEEKPQGDYLCENYGDWYWKCKYNEITRWCREIGESSLSCEAYYQKSSQQQNWWYYFEPSWGGEFFCSYSHVESITTSDLENASYHGEYSCAKYNEEWDSEEWYVWCEYREDRYFCPTELYACSERIDWYYCEPNEETWYYYCEADSTWGDMWPDRWVDIRSITSEWTYTCYDIYGDNYPIYNCKEPKLRWGQGYECLFPKYTCIQEDWGYYCTEGYEWEDDSYYYCEMNEFWDNVAKSSVSAMGYYSCYQPKEWGNEFTNCEWEDQGEYFCYSTYVCELDKDGYNCIEDGDGEYYCQHYNLAIPQEINSINWDYYCYNHFGNQYDYCSKNDEWNGYLCPIKWWTKFNTNGDYECLAEWAEFNEDLGQCVYTVTGYDGEDIIIMASNLWVTADNLTWLYYQWGRNYGFPGYNWDIDDNRIYAPLDGVDRTTFNDYPTDEIPVWPADKDPCPTKFHLPSTREWNNLLISWCENTALCDAAKLTKHYSLSNHWAFSDVDFEWSFENEVYSFMNDLNFPLWGSRDADYVNMLSYMGDYWAKEFYGTGNSRWFTLYPEWWLGAVPFISNHGVQVRCFADIEEDEEISTPVALDLYIWWCAQQDMFTATSAIEVLENSMLCDNNGYRWRKFVSAGDEIDLDDLNNFLPSWHQWVWYLDDDKQTKLPVGKIFTEDAELYAFEEELLDEYTITFDSNGWTPTPAAQSIVYWSKATEPTNNPTKNWYTFGGWMLDWVEFNFSTPIVWSITLTAKWDVLHYNITYKDGETEVQWLEPSSYTVEDNLTLPTLPTKTGYKFDGRSDNGTKITKIQAWNTWNKTLVAIWTEDKPSWWNSGWYSGWGSPSKPSSKWSWPSSTEVKSKGDGPDTPAKEGTKTEPKPVVVWKADNYTGKVNPNQELFDTYEWAYANGLTKYGNMSDARMNDILNRQEMAKITTIFASKFKNNTPNEDKRDFCSQYPDLWKTTEDMQEYIIQSCELGYMWYRANGIDALDRFRPYTPVSVAEVSIILSRIMWQNKYAINENLRYQWHLHAVYENNLLDNISKPFDYILRKDAYIMLYRISKTL